MSPMPINASMGRRFFLVVAFVFTPRMSNLMPGRRREAKASAGEAARLHHSDGGGKALRGLFGQPIRPFLAGLHPSRVSCCRTALASLSVQRAPPVPAA